MSFLSEAKRSGVKPSADSTAKQSRAKQSKGVSPLTKV